MAKSYHKKRARVNRIREREAANEQARWEEVIETVRTSNAAPSNMADAFRRAVAA